MSEKKMYELIADEIRGGKDNWWKSSGRETYIRLAERLYKLGLLPTEIKVILRTAFRTAAEECGN